MTTPTTHGGKRPGAGPKANKVARMRKGDVVITQTSGRINPDFAYIATVAEIHDDKITLQLSNGVTLIITL